MSTNPGLPVSTSERVPTPHQARMLRSYTRGILVAPGRTVTSLVRWGWLETTDDTSPVLDASGHYPPLRVSAAGWRAIGLAIDRGRLPAYTYADTTHCDREMAA